MHSALGAAILVLALAACTAIAPQNSGAPQSSAASTAAGHTPGSPVSTPTTTAGPVAPSPTATPVLRPKLSASENRAYFDAVNKRVIAGNAHPGGRAFIDALVAAGFDKADMQVTPDRTSIDLAVGSIQFAVRFNGQCLIGQFGPDGIGYHSEVASVLSTGKCLIGKTRPIDW